MAEAVMAAGMLEEEEDLDDSPRSLPLSDQSEGADSPERDKAEASTSASNAHAHAQVEGEVSDAKGAGSVSPKDDNVKPSPSTSKVHPRLASSPSTTATVLGVMSSVGSAVASLSSYAAPHLGGAMDILAVRQPSGRLLSSPWYVRFGKYQGLLHGRERTVKVSANGNQVAEMHLGRTGEAYFVVPGAAEGSEEIAVDENGEEAGSEKEAGEEDFLTNLVSPASVYSSDDDDSVESPSPRQRQVGFEKEGDLEARDIEAEEGIRLLASRKELARSLLSSDFHEIVQSSDSNSITREEETGQGEAGVLSRSGSVSSSTLVEEPATAVLAGDAHLVETAAEKENGGGGGGGGGGMAANLKKNCEYGKPQDDSVSPRGGGMRGIELSMCGPLLKESMSDEEVRMAFEQHLVSAADFSMGKEGILGSPNLVARLWNDQIYPWSVALDLLVQYHAYGKALPVPESCPAGKEDGALPSGNDEPSGGWSLSKWFNRSKKVESSSTTPPSGKETATDQHTVTRDAVDGDFPEAVGVTVKREEGKVPAPKEGKRKAYRKTLKPTSDILESMNLVDGQNLLCFTFTTALWGVQQVHAFLYVHPWNVRLVVSDIDGTITRSDVMGQLLPMVGGDWSQAGVTALYSDIVLNGYKIMYLSSRAIAQASATRDYLANVQQDGECLPQGPVIMSPDGILPSLYREIIRRRPQDFKIACLQNIRGLFPKSANPFYAGFGNRDTDVISYKAVGIPDGKIFTLNSRGQVVVSSAVLFTISNLSGVNDFIDSIFPAVDEQDNENSDGLHVQEQYNDFNFWKPGYSGMGAIDEEINAA